MDGEVKKYYDDRILKNAQFTIKEAIDCLMIYIKNTTIDCFEPHPGIIYTVSIRSKITKQVDYEKVIEFIKKYNKEEYEKCLNNFTSK